jgi:hypothetical protein
MLKSILRFFDDYTKESPRDAEARAKKNILESKLADQTLTKYELEQLVPLIDNDKELDVLIQNSLNNRKTHLMAYCNPVLSSEAKEYIDRQDYKFSDMEFSEIAENENLPEKIRDTAFTREFDCIFAEQDSESTCSTMELCYSFNSMGNKNNYLPDSNNRFYYQNSNFNPSSLDSLDSKDQPKILDRFKLDPPHLPRASSLVAVEATPVTPLVPARKVSFSIQ